MTDESTNVVEMEDERSEIIERWEFNGFECILKKITLMSEEEMDDLTESLEEEGLGGPTMREYHYCGYTRIPAEFRDAIDTTDLNVHGGITWNDLEDSGWIGWDANHYMDTPGNWNAENATSEEWVKSQTESLVFQICCMIEGIELPDAIRLMDHRTMKVLENEKIREAVSNEDDDLQSILTFVIDIVKKQMEEKEGAFDPDEMAYLKGILTAVDIISQKSNVEGMESAMDLRGDLDE